jgi:hypothetical protein
MNMLESTIEDTLRKGVIALGGLCLKFTPEGKTGVPDRIVALPDGRTIYVELKAPGGRVSPMQAYIHEELRKRKHDVRVLKSKVEVLEFLDEVQASLVPDFRARLSI